MFVQPVRAELTLQFTSSSLMNEVVHTSPTIGSNVEEIVVKNTHFLMWDIGGQESLRSSWNTYYSNTEVSGHAFRFVFLF